MDGINLVLNIKLTIRFLLCRQQTSFGDTTTELLELCNEVIGWFRGMNINQKVLLTRQSSEKLCAHSYFYPTLIKRI
jgi:hypothetical protein